MKADIHPEYKDTTITCACGNVFNLRSAGEKMHINTCAQCHPFYTGQAKFIDTEGRVEKFRKRYASK
jgi:large subunit ribosomal protein L31